MLRPMPPTLETARLILRPKRLEDLPRTQELFPHWEIVKYMAATIPWPYRPEAAEDYYRTVALPANESGDEYHWTLALKADPERRLIGNISLTPKDKEDSRGFWIGLPYQRLGYMKEAVCAVNDFAFDVLGMPELILNNAEPNLASHRMKELSGASIIARNENHPYCGGQTFTQIRWRLTAEAWRANRHKFGSPAL